MATIYSPGIQSMGPGPVQPGQPWYYDPMWGMSWENQTAQEKARGGANAPMPGTSNRRSKYVGQQQQQPSLPNLGNLFGQLGGGGGGGGVGGTGLPSVQSTITPTNIYTPQMTQQAVNQAVASNTPDMRTAMKRFTQPGVSRSAGTMASAMPQFAGNALQQRSAAAEIPLLDTIANQKHMMAGQVAREEEALQMANLMSRYGNLQQRQQLNNMNLGSNLLGSLLGGSLFGGLT